MKNFLRLSVGRMLAGMAILVFTVASASGAAENSAQDVVRNTTEQVLEVLRKEGDGLKSDSERLYQLIDHLILPHFDFRKMSRWVLGRHWRKATEAQKKAFIEQFQGLLVRTYAQALIDYRDQKVEFLPVNSEAADTVVVRTRINQAGGPPIPITYKMAMEGNDWKVYDVSIDGVSLVINYRASFNQEIKRNGIDGLIRRLSSHNSKNT